MDTILEKMMQSSYNAIAVKTVEPEPLVLALLQRIDKKTIHRKLIFLGLEARKYNQLFRKHTIKAVHHLQFDDLITKEVTKLKPVTISVAVDAQTRKIFSLQAAQIPAFGHLAQLSKKKYGQRRSKHKVGLEKVFRDLKNCVHPSALIRSDKHHFYSEYVNYFFPKADYETYKSEKATVAGQGELKRKKNDPIYCINHTHAMLRDNINRLVRKSWCVSQSIDYLQLHLEIYMKFHNENLV